VLPAHRLGRVPDDVIGDVARAVAGLQLGEQAAADRVERVRVPFGRVRRETSGGEVGAKLLRGPVAERLPFGVGEDEVGVGGGAADRAGQAEARYRCSSASTAGCTGVWRLLACVFGFLRVFGPSSPSFASACLTA